MKGRLCIRGTELKPMTCASFPLIHFSFTPSLPIPFPPLVHSHFFSTVFARSGYPHEPSHPLSPLLQPSLWTVSEWPPLSMALSCCDLTAIKCQIKLMDSNCQRAEAYTPQWIIVMEWVMSWLCCSLSCSSSFSLSVFYLFVSLMMSCLMIMKAFHTCVTDEETVQIQNKKIDAVKK